MKIGHYMPEIWERGGIASYLKRVAGAQRAAGHEVVFLDSSPRFAGSGEPEDRPVVVPTGALAARGAELGLDVLHLHTEVPVRPVGGPAVVRTVHGHRPYCPSGERYFRRTDRPCDRAFSVAGCLWGHVVDRCGSVRPASVARNFAATRGDRRVLDHITSIAISHFVREQMIRSSYDPGRIRVVYNPAPPARAFEPPPRDGRPRFLFIGRLVVHKGLQWLLRSLKQTRRPMAIDVAGDGPQGAEMRAMARELGLDDVVTFHGWADEPKLNALAAASRGVVFPAVWHEPAGLSCLDGSSRGRAVLGSRSGGLPEYAVDGQNALLVGPNDDAGLASALDRLAEDWDLARSLGVTGHAMAAGPFSLDRHVAALDQIYRELAR